MVLFGPVISIPPLDDVSGVNWLVRKFATNAPFSMEIKQDGDHYTLILDSLKIKQRDEFILGLEKDFQHFGHPHKVRSNITHYEEF